MVESEEEFLKKYNVEEFKRPSVTVDIVVFTLIKGKIKVLLIKRGMHPFLDCWALPGGFVKMDKSLINSASKELMEKTGISKKDAYLEQLYTFGNPKRDPRTRVISVAYYALVDSSKIKLKKEHKKNIKDIRWVSVYKLPEKMAFDHREIIMYALKRLRYKLEYTAVGFELLPELFTLTELQKLYSEILNEKLDKRNFRKKILSLGILKPTKEYRKGMHRPARLYKFIESKPSSTFKKIKFEKK